MRLLQNKKHVFWEAFVLTIFIFLIGFLFGTYIEGKNFNKLNDYSTTSEINLIDGVTLTDLSKTVNISCSFLKEKNIEFADKIYNEAKLLEQYEESGKLTDSMKILHKKYDLLRTLAWMGNSNTMSKCHNYSLIIYLYEYETQDLNIKATQSVWSRKLTDIKEQSSDMILLPIAVDEDISSLDIILNQYNVTQYPALIVNDKYVVYDIDNFSLDSY